MTQKFKELFVDALFTVTAAAPSPSARYVVSLLDNPAVISPLRGAAVKIRNQENLTPQDWARLCDVLRRDAADSRSIIILASGPHSARAALELVAGLKATAWLLSPETPPEGLSTGSEVRVLFDPKEASHRSAARAWNNSGAVVVPVPGAGPWPRFLLELPGVLPALATDRNPAETGRKLRQTLRSARSQSAYPLLVLGQHLASSHHRKDIAAKVLEKACNLSSPLQTIIRFELAETQRRMGQLRRALDNYKRVVAERPNSAWYWLRASQTAFEAYKDGATASGTASFAAHAANQALSLDPEMAGVREQKAKLEAAGHWPPVGLATSHFVGAAENRLWWKDLSRQEFVAVRCALALQDKALPKDALEIASLLEMVRQGKLPPNRLTTDAVLNCMCSGSLLRLRHGTLEVSSRNTLKVLAEEILAFDEYRFHTENPAPRVIDCGVNFGLSLYSTKSQYPAARITGFEPHPEMFELAQANVRRNGWQESIILHQAAVGDKEGRATLYLSPEDDMAASLGSRLSESGQTVKPVEVNVVPLSRFLQEPADFLKMDIEGVEHEVLAECEAALANVETLFCEYHHTPGGGKDRLSEITSILWRAGFDSYFTGSPWVARKYAGSPVEAAQNSHSLSIFARKRRSKPSMKEECPETIGKDHIVKFGGYDALVRPGTTNKLVVSVAGIGIPEDDRMAYEWNGSFQKLGVRDHIICIRDLQRSWANNPDGLDNLVSFLKSYMRRHRIEDSLIFGLSMGGFGALVLDHYVNFRRVVAISPQLLVGPDCSFDNRYTELWKKISTFKHTDARSLVRPGGTYQVVFSLDDAKDILHLQTLAGYSNVEFLAYRGQHNIGSEMSSRFQLLEFVQAFINDSNSLAPFGIFKASEVVKPLISLVQNTSDQNVLNFVQKHPEWLASAHLDHFAQLQDSTLEGFPCPLLMDASPPRMMRYLSTGWKESGRSAFIAAANNAEMSLHLLPGSQTDSANLKLLFRVVAPHQTPVTVQMHINGCLHDSLALPEGEPDSVFALRGSVRAGPTKIVLSTDTAALGLADLGLEPLFLQLRPSQNPSM